MARKRYLIVGDGAAGLTAAEELRRRDGDANVGVFCDEPNPGYFRAALTNFLLGELREDQLWAVPPNFYDQQRVERVFTRVLRVDPARRQVWCSGNAAPLGYDALLVASGARARSPDFPGSHLPGVLTLRTIQDARRVVDVLRGKVERAVVLGGGALGLEWAHALLERGVKVTLVERAQRLMMSALDAVASDLLAARLRTAGIDVVLGEEVTHAEQGPSGGVSALFTKSGRRLSCEVIAAALGIVPNGELLEGTGAVRAKSGAVEVDDTLATSLPGVWAAGDVASVGGEQLGLWAPAREQGRVAAVNMCGGREQYRPGAHYFATRLFDLDFARIGDPVEGPGRTPLIDFPRGTGHIAYRKLVLEGGRLRGALLLGERRAKVRTIARGLKRLIDAGADVSAVAERLLEPSFDVGGFLETPKLMAPPATRATSALPVVPAAKLRGTQMVSLGSALSGLHARAGTAVLGSGVLRELAAAPGTLALPSARAPATSLLPSRASLVPSHAPSLAALEPRATRLLSIGLHAEAAPEPLTGERALEGRFELLGQSFPIQGKLTSIGTGPEAQVRLNDPSVAYLHAQVAQHGQALYLRDAGSQTGTWVNDVPLAGAHPLRDGDRVRLGRTELTFRSLSLTQQAAAAAPLIAVPRLELRSGPSSGLSFVLSGESALIGSGAQVDLQISEPSVAPLHALVRLAQGLHYLSDQGSPSGTYLRGGRLHQGQEVVLSDGELFQLGAVVVAYTRAPTADRLAAFRPMARLAVVSGAGAGQSATFAERALVGAAPDAQLRPPGAASAELEVLLHQGNFFARDRSGGRTFKSGAPLTEQWAPLRGGELLLLSSGALLCFEEP
jgi:NADPH-dependent 2,4-dienoyl-CoA reductase/sulfur reductase-like enzyme/pSer/pThr/pTyr-binding forkhead associated (FHA) protein